MQNPLSYKDILEFVNSEKKPLTTTDITTHFKLKEDVELKNMSNILKELSKDGEMYFLI